MRKRIFGIMAATVLFAGSAIYAVSSKDECPLAGTSECPMVFDCPLAGTPECPLIAEKGNCCR